MPGSAVATLENATPYMLRYRVAVTGEGATVTIPNNSVAASPNLLVDSLDGSPLQKAINQPGLASNLAAWEALMENENLRVTTVAESTGIVSAVGVDSNPDATGGRPNAIVSMEAAGGTGADGSFISLTIEFRHSIER